MTQAIFPFARALRFPLMLLAVAGLAGCDPATSPADQDPPEPGVLEATRNGPPGAAEGTCWGKTVSPAVIERITEQVQIRPAQVNPDGTIAKPPVYRTEDKQVIVTPRRDNWFETPCQDALSPEFIASLQRALQARNRLAGPITGTFDPPTREAVARLQKQNGLNSSVLSLETARGLGLIAVPRTALE
jgi:hypothetical protein